MILVGSIFVSSLVLAKQIGGIEMPNNLKIDNSELILNGAGLREKWFLDLYVGGLYLTKKMKHPSRIYVAPAFKKKLQLKAVEETGGNVVELTRKMSKTDIFEDFDEKNKKKKNGFKMQF